MPFVFGSAILERMNVSMKIHSFTNLTSAIDILKNREATEIAEFGEADFVTYLPQAVRENTMITLKGLLQMGGKMQELEITGKVLACREISPGNFQLKVHLRQYEKPLWAEILNVASKNQTNADTIFTAIKGDT